MESAARRARAAGRVLACTSPACRHRALQAIHDALTSRSEEILSANAVDVAAAVSAGNAPALVSRLKLDAAKLAGVIAGVSQVMALAEPLGLVSLARELSPGLELRRRSTPLGVICVIFEARPEAVVQIACLTIKSGNALLLKGGKEAAASNAILGEIVRGALAAAAAAGGGVPEDAVQLLSTREEVAELLRMDELIDLVIPRGSNALVRSVKAATRIPVLGHADGVCHVYVDAVADLARACAVVVDSKTQYPAACNAAECLLVAEAALRTHLPALARALLAAGVTLVCDGATAGIARVARAELLAEQLGAGGEGEPPLPLVEDAVDLDFTTEWLSLRMGVRAVADCAAAAAYINAHGSHHTDAIVTEDAAAAALFLAQVDSAGVFHNASTRFADGHRYGFGAEVGVSTNRIHARGPVGLEGLLTYKYVLTSTASSGHTVAQFAAAGVDAVTVSGQQLPALSFTHQTLEG